MAELADQVESGEVVNDAPIPDAPVDTGIEASAPKETKEAKPKSIREALNSAIEQAKEDEKGRLHAKDGKFAPKPVEAKVEIQKTEKDVQPKASEAVGPPPGWSAESKAAFATLPDHIKADLVKREKEVSDGFKKYSDNDKRFQEIEQVLAPSRQAYQQAGVKSDAEAIKALFGWEASLRNPATRMQAFNNLARQYGVNLNSPTQTQDAIPDQLRPVLDQFGQLQQQVNTFTGEIQRQREAQVSDQLAIFAKDKPHFDKVRVKMGQLMQAGLATDLEGAYQQAIYADPDTRAELIKEQTEKQLAELKKNQTQHSQAARQAAISPVGRSPTGVPNGAKPGKLSVREAINASIRELSDNRA